MSKSFSKTFCFNSDYANENYELNTDLFSKIVNKHAPLKKKFLRSNQAHFINKDRSRLRNRFCKTPTEENEKLCKKQRNKCASIRKCVQINDSNKQCVTNNVINNV